MKKGDRVTIKDYSWVQSISHGKLTHDRPNTFDDRGVEYTVVETDCSFPLKPACDIPQPRQSINNTVIESDDGTVVFINAMFLKLVDPPHVWKHGDIFENCVDYTKWIYLEPNSKGPIVVELMSAGGGGTPSTQLNGATFLFNVKTVIKDKLHA